MKKLYVMLIFVFGMSLFAQIATAPAIGDGSVGDPYQIYTLENLYWIASSSVNWDKNYIQTSNIDASATSSWFSGQGWIPIGNSTTRFTGTYDGQSFKIEDLFINRPSIEYGVGFFGYTTNATISNLKLSNVNINGDQIVGALVGGNLSSDIINCQSSGTVDGDFNIGGLVGSNSINANIDFCSSSCTVTARTWGAGGLVGMNYSSSTIENSFARGNSTSASYSGGLVARNSDSSSIIKSYSTGTATGSSWTGGLVGENDNSSVNASFWDTQTSGHPLSQGGTGVLTSQMKNQTTFTSAGWDFTNDWAIDGTYNNGYPHLIQLRLSLPTLSTYAVTDITLTTATANGSIDDLGYSFPAQHGFCWNTTGMPTLSDTKTENGPIDSLASFTGNITGISVGNTYYVRAYATNEVGTSYGQEVNFRIPELAVLTTDSATAITNSSSTIYADLTDLGYPDPTEHGVCWSVNSNPSTSDFITTEGSTNTTGVFTSDISSLDPLTTYYVRAYAINAKGTSYGNEINFTTLDNPPVDPVPEGSGTEIDPYLIETFEHLVWITKDDTNWSYHYLQTADIDASPSDTLMLNILYWGPGWSPIGHQYVDFTGSYNGQGFSIDSLFIDCDLDEIGLFGNTNNATIENINLTNTNITGDGNVGSLIGLNYQSDVTGCTASGDVNGSGNVGGLIGYSDGNIDSCSFSGTVYGTYNNVGGLIGQISSSTILNSYSNSYTTCASQYGGGLIGQAFGSQVIIENSYSVGELHGMYTIGGLVGMMNNGGLILNCYSNVDVYGDIYDYYYYYEISEQVGGLVGQNYASDIYNSYSTGTVFGIYDVGGFIGTNNNASDVINCYSTGEVTCDNEPGGFIGLLYNGTSAVITNCFWDTETSGLATSQGGAGVIGKTTTEMKTQTTFTDATWDFVVETTNGTNDYWKINASINSGYPFLSWQDVVLPLSTPENLIVVQSTDPVLSWDTVLSATSYTIYYSEDPYAVFPTAWTEVTGVTETTWTDTGATETKKFYLVVAVN